MGDEADWPAAMESWVEPSRPRATPDLSLNAGHTMSKSPDLGPEDRARPCRAIAHPCFLLGSPCALHFPNLLSYHNSAEMGWISMLAIVTQVFKVVY
jgi:hypothetical protein